MKAYSIDFHLQYNAWANEKICSLLSKTESEVIKKENKILMGDILDGSTVKVTSGSDRLNFRSKPTVVKAEGSLDERHVNNFLDCMKTRKLPNGDVLIGHRAAQASHPRPAHPSSVAW